MQGSAPQIESYRRSCRADPSGASFGEKEAAKLRKQLRAATERGPDRTRDLIYAPIHTCPLSGIPEAGVD